MVIVEPNITAAACSKAPTPKFVCSGNGEGLYEGARVDAWGEAVVEPDAVEEAEEDEEWAHCG